MNERCTCITRESKRFLEEILIQAIVVSVSKSNANARNLIEILHSGRGKKQSQLVVVLHVFHE
jgi:hypothetical protein